MATAAAIRGWPLPTLSLDFDFFYAFHPSAQAFYQISGTNARQYQTDDPGASIQA
jgi:hypothetical protein